MKTRYFKNRVLAAAASLLCVASLSACADDIVVGKPIDEGDYAALGENTVLLKDAASGKSAVDFTFVEGNYASTVKINLTKAVATDTPVQVKVDADYLTAYNEEHDTAYELLPTEQVTFENEGAVTLAAGANNASVGMTIAAGSTLEIGKSYAVPVTLTAGSDLSVKKVAGHCLYTVTMAAELPTCHKGDDLPKGFLYFEVNDVNPLNALACQLEDGRLIWDVVCLFAANINHNADEDRPYVQCNPNVQFLLDNNEIYLQPLRKRGIKVLLGILGNHDQAGVSQLSEQGAKVFAAELARYCEAYNLDGVNFDDEYSNSPDLSHPAYTNRGGAASARLCYETKKAMPDKMVTTYDYGSMSLSGFPTTIDDVNIANWVDLAVADYGGTTSPRGEMTYKNCSGCSTEFNRGSGSNLTDSRAQSMMDTGYGWFMGFALNPDKNMASQLSRISGVGTFYGSPLKNPTFYYKKNDPTPYPIY